MKHHIAIIGHGNVGGALALRFAAAGHSVHIGARRPEDAEVLSLAVQPGISAHGIAEAVAASGIVLVATPAHIVLDLIPTLGDLAGKILIDATNAVVKKPEPYPTAFAAFRATTPASVVKCFNTTGFENMAQPQYDGTAIDLFMASSDSAAKAVVRQLALDAGFGECYDFGGDDKVQLLEQFALSWINLAIMQGMGRGIALKLLKR
jgi:8-hydroxy-5-deazaflavin:NADPH oxidoreductase